MRPRLFFHVFVTLSLVLLCIAAHASPADASTTVTVGQRSHRIPGVAQDVQPVSVGRTVPVPPPLKVSEAVRAISVRKGKIIHATNDSFFDGPTEGGGVIFLAGNVLKTDRRRARLEIVVNAVRKSGGRVGRLAAKWSNCRNATSCQVTAFEKRHGQNYEVPTHFTGEIDTIAEGIWYRRGKPPLVDVDTQVYNFVDGLLQP